MKWVSLVRNRPWDTRFIWRLRFWDTAVRQVCNILLRVQERFLFLRRRRVVPVRPVFTTSSSTTKSGIHSLGTRYDAGAKIHAPIFYDKGKHGNTRRASFRPDRYILALDSPNAPNDYIQEKQHEAGNVRPPDPRGQSNRRIYRASARRENSQRRLAV